MKLILGTLSLLLLCSGLAGAQTADEVQITVGAYELATNGAEKPAGVWRVSGPLAIGRPTIGIFSMSGCGGFSLRVPPNSFREGASVGWRVEVTPTRIVNHAVTFRLQWIRMGLVVSDSDDNSPPAVERSGAAPSREDVEVTLQPGESRPLDSVPVPPGAATRNGRPCATRSVSLRVQADFPEFDSRLIGADLWLVEKLASGREQSYLQALRGLPHREIPFYFDGITDGAKRLDIFGHVVADPEQGGFEIDLQTIRAVADPGNTVYEPNLARWFKATVHVKPDETVEVALPKMDANAGAFANRMFSIRIRAKQIR